MTERLLEDFVELEADSTNTLSDGDCSIEHWLSDSLRVVRKAGGTPGYHAHVRIDGI